MKEYIEHCRCCDVRFDGEVFNNDIIFSKKTENYKWSKNDQHPCSGSICFWCAWELYGDIPLIAIGVMLESVINGNVYNIGNFKTFPPLAARIKNLGLIPEKQDDSKWNCKCKSCGAPAYQGLMSIECSKGCK